MASKIQVDKISRNSGTPEFTIPTADGTAGQFLKTDGSGVLAFDTVTTNPLTLTGSTNNTIPTVTGANALAGEANFTYDGNVLDIKNSGTASSINLYCESSNAHYIKLKSGPHASATSYTLTLPNAPPSVSGQLLSATTAGVASWATVASAENTPAFSVHQKTAQDSQTMGTWIKCNYNTEDFDTDSAFDTATNRFTVPAGKAGKYYIYARVWMSSSSGQGAMHSGLLQFYKNGSGNLDHLAFHDHRTSASQGSLYITTWLSEMIDLDAADYIEVYCQGNGGGTLKIDNNYNTFGGFKVV